MIEQKRLHKLHSIRGWAALFVAIAHAKYAFWSGGRDYLEQFPISGWSLFDYPIFLIDLATSFGSVFVIVFFVLSGFFIARMLSVGKHSIWSFYGDRIIRIYIPYIGSMIFGLLAIQLANQINPGVFATAIDRPYNHDAFTAFHDIGLGSFVNAIFFSPGTSGQYFAMNYPYWSLWYEALFYITAPFLIWYLPRFGFFYVAVALWAVSWGVASSWLSIASFFLKYLIFFGAGVVIYEVSQNMQTRLWLVKELRAHTNFYIVLAIVTILVAMPVGLAGYKKLGYLLGMMSAALLIMLILYARNTTSWRLYKRLLINRFSVFLGKISFSLYLIHVPVFLFLYSITTAMTGQYVFYDRVYWLAVIAVVPLAYLFYLSVEAPSLRLLGIYKKSVRRATTRRSMRIKSVKPR